MKKGRCNRVKESIKNGFKFLSGIWNLLCNAIISGSKEKKEKISDAICRSIIVNEKLGYEDFTPQKRIKNGEVYLNALEWAIKNPNVKNVALSGPYGSGKSSIIQSYKKLHPSVRSLNISLATFNFKYSGDNLPPEKEAEIERGILKQLFYKVDGKKIPQSRYRKLHKISIYPYVKIIGIFSILIILFVVFFLAEKNEIVIDVLLSYKRYWGIRSESVLFMLIISWMLCVYIIAQCCKWITTKFHLKEINLADKATVEKTQDNSETIFNKNMDEIIYFFEESDYSVIFIEDLDRFGNTEIFVKLREINTILNNYDLITRRIIFVYAIRDDMFLEKDRTKFFDFIIPVIPVINSTNSSEILREKLDVQQKDDGTYCSLKYDISSRFITMVSPFISDMRVLTSICNEFIVYKKTLKDNQNLGLKDENMFAMMIFKNLYPKDFADLEAERGLVKKAFVEKREFVNNKIEALKKSNWEIEKTLCNIEEDILKDLKELKAAFLSYLTGYEGIVSKIVAGKKEYTLSCIMDDSFDMSLLNVTNLRVNFYKYNNYSDSKFFADIDKDLKIDGRHYFERFVYLRNSEEKRKEKMKIKLEENEKENSLLRSFSLAQIIETNRVEEVLSSEILQNELLVFMLRHGYINENYADYINYFHPNSITKDEMNFILGIRNFKAVGDFSYPLKNCSQIVERIEDFEFEQSEILNFDLLNYLVLKSLKSEKCRRLLKQLSNRSVESKQFIKEYMDKGDNIALFMNELCKYNRMLWYDWMKDNSITEDKKCEYLSIIIETVDIEDIVDLNIIDTVTKTGVLKNFIEGRADILQRLSEVPAEKLQQVIIKLDLRFSNIIIKRTNPQVVSFIFDNNLYDLNMNMLKNLMTFKCFKDTDRLYVANYTTVRQLEYEPLMSYICQDFEGYVQKFVLDQKENVKEDITAVEDILERLYSLNIEMCYKVIQKQPVIWENIQDCCKRETEEEEARTAVQLIWNYILELERMKPKWNNFLVYYEIYGLTKQLLGFIDKHMNVLVEARDPSVLTEDIVSEIILSDISLNSFRTFIRTYKLDDFNNIITEIDGEKIRVLVEENYFDFSAARLVELREKEPSLCISFIKNNKEKFIQEASECEMKVGEVTSLLKLDIFTREEKKEILGLIDSKDIDEELALVIRELDFLVDKQYVESAWEKLKKENKYQLLLNQMNVFTCDELEKKFAVLDSAYHQFLDRSRRHKVSLTDNEYNKHLMDMLLAMEYLTSYDQETIISKDATTEMRLIGWVKQKK